MPYYNCEECQFGTYRLFDMERHVKTKKHIRKLAEYNTFNMANNLLHDISDNDDYISESSCDYDYNDAFLEQKLFIVKKGELKCEYCGNDFTCYQNLWRHKKHYCKHNKDCKPKKVNKSKKIKPNNSETNKPNDLKINSNQEKINSNDENMKFIINELKEQREEMREQNKKLLELASKNADVSMVTAKSTNKSMNMMSHAMKYWANAPPMRQLEGKEALKLITFENKSKHPIEDVILHQFNSGTLYRFLGNVLIKEFKKEDEVDQSLWTTDSARLCFIIKQIVGDEGGDGWITDKSGIEITKLLISPLVNRVIEMMNDYSKKCAKDVSEAKDNEKSKIAMEKMHDAGSLIRGIVKNDLRKKILQYIAPYFNINIKNIELQKV